MHITVLVCVAPRMTREVVLELPEGATVLQALLASGLPGAVAGAEPGLNNCGIWGRKVSPDQVLHESDRVEVYRALVVDPKVARRLRFVRQGVRASGLFARKRPGAKPGY